MVTLFPFDTKEKNLTYVTITQHLIANSTSGKVIYKPNFIGTLSEIVERSDNVKL